MPELIESRWKTGEGFKRELIAEVRAGEDSRTVELSFSSEMPVDRGMYQEVLLHDEVNMDLSRLSDGAHPLLLNHECDDQIGVVVRASCDTAKKRGVATVKFSRSSDGEEILQDVKDGIRRLVSVGYIRTSEVRCETVDGVETCYFAWQPYEISIVAIPADASVGIGRKQTISEAPKEKQIMSVVETNTYQKEAAEILAIAKNLRGKVIDIDELANGAITSGQSVNDFRAAALSRLPEIKPMQKPILSDVPVRQWASYSITRAIQGQMDGKMSGLEKELSDEAALQTGQRAQGFWVPPQALARNMVAGTGTLGGFAVATDNLGSEFIELLRNRAMVAQLGARILTLNNPVTIPRHAAAGSANWLAETTASTLSTGNFEQLTLQPFGVSAFQQYSKQLLYTSNPSIDMIVQDDLNAIIGLAIDKAALHGSGSGQPLGIANTTGIGTISVAMLAAASLGSSLFPFMVSLETSVATSNADGGALAYLVNAKTRAAAKVTQQFATTGSDPVWMGQRDGSGILNGYRAHSSNQIAVNLTTGTATTICTAAFFGNWNELLIAQFNGGATDIVIDPYTLAVNGVVRVLARRWVDIGVRHAASFAMGGGILA